MADSTENVPEVQQEEQPATTTTEETTAAPAEETTVVPVEEAPAATTEEEATPAETTAVATEVTAHEVSAEVIAEVIAEATAEATPASDAPQEVSQEVPANATATAPLPRSSLPVVTPDGPNPYAHGGADPFPSNSDVLRMRGLPYTATEEDIRTFYEGYAIAEGANSIVIISQGYHRGEGFVQFATVEQCSEAHAKLNRQCIGPRYIELYPSTESAMLLAAQQLQAMGDQKNFIIRLRGLPSRPPM